MGIREFRRDGYGAQAVQPSLRDSARQPGHPALKRRAISGRPVGTGQLRMKESETRLIRGSAVFQPCLNVSQLARSARSSIGSYAKGKVRQFWEGI
jgi:hypothetical protein